MEQPSEGFTADEETKFLIIGECSMGDQPLLAIEECVVVTVRDSFLAFLLFLFLFSVFFRFFIFFFPSIERSKLTLYLSLTLKS